MSHVGMIGSPDAFKANLLNLRQNLQEIVTPLGEVTPGLPWQRTFGADEYRAPQPDFENILREALTPEESGSSQEGSSFRATTPDQESGQQLPKPERQSDSLPPQLSRNNMEFELRLAQQENASMFNYTVKSAGGHYRTELARNAYSAALGRLG